jgi:hypothetical protein
LGTEEKRGRTVRSSTDEIFEKLTEDKKNWIRKRINELGGKREHRT